MYEIFQAFITDFTKFKRPKCHIPTSQIYESIHVSGGDPWNSRLQYAIASLRGPSGNQDM